MDGQSLLDQYPFPGQLSDPAELEKAKYLALMRMGMGLMGKEPIGTATGHGLATYATMEENARRNADQKMQEMAGRMKYAIEMNKEALAAKKQKQLEDYGKNFDVSQYYAAGGSPQELEYARKNPEYWPKIFEKLKPETMSPGQMIRVPGIGFIDGVPDKDGMVNIIDPDTFKIIERKQLAGQTLAMANQAGAIKAAEQANTFQTNVPGPTGPRSGYPQNIGGGLPPAMMGQQAPQGQRPPPIFNLQNQSPEGLKAMLADVQNHLLLESCKGKTRWLLSGPSRETRQCLSSASRSLRISAS